MATRKCNCIVTKRVREDGTLDRRIDINVYRAYWASLTSKQKAELGAKANYEQVPITVVAHEWGVEDDEESPLTKKQAIEAIDLLHEVFIGPDKNFDHAGNRTTRQVTVQWRDRARVLLETLMTKPWEQ